MRAAVALLVLLLSSTGVNVVVTFPSLAEDVKLLACSQDRVTSLVPRGVDPHSYELRPEDVSTLKGADLIISTAHTPFETSIRKLELGAELLEIPSLVMIRENPVTGKPNYHMPVYDPQNYILFMESVKSVMSKLNPGCRDEYEARYREVKSRVESLINRARSLNLSMNALATTPLVQYAVEWTGIKVRYLILKEAGVPATPQDLARAKRAAQRGEIQVVVLMEGEPEQIEEKALEIAKEYGLPYFKVPSPLKAEPIPDKLEEILNRVQSMKREEKKGLTDPLTIVGMLAFMAVILVALWRLSRD